MNIKDYIEPNEYDSEKCSINDDVWYVETLIKHASDLPVFDLDLSSLDLDVMPWELKSIFHYIDHFMQTNNCSLEYPVIMSPSGWVMNGWHRISKALIEGRQTVKAVRFKKLPTPDGKRGE